MSDYFLFWLDTGFEVLLGILFGFLIIGIIRGCRDGNQRISLKRGKWGE